MTKIALFSLLLTLMTPVLGSANIFLQNCHNFGDDMSFAFESCVRNNFYTVERETEGAIYFEYCTNGSREGVSFGYESCVNRNFMRIANYHENQYHLFYCQNSSRDRLTFAFESCINNNFRKIEGEFNQ